jgi:hypothetical protein
MGLKAAFVVGIRRYDTVSASDDKAPRLESGRINKRHLRDLFNYHVFNFSRLTLRRHSRSGCLQSTRHRS